MNARVGVEEFNSVSESHVHGECSCFVGRRVLMSQHRYPTTLLPCSILRRDTRLSDSEANISFFTGININVHRKNNSHGI